MLGIDIDIIKAHLRSIFALLEKIDRFIDSDSIDPGVEARPAFKRLQGLKSFDKSLLRQVIGILMIGGHVINCSVNALLIALYELIISVEVTFPGRFHQL